MHHPPFVTGIRHMDEINLTEGAQRLAELVRAHGRSSAFSAGTIIARSRPCSAGRSRASRPASRIRSRSTSIRRTRARLEPPAIRLHLYRPDAGIVSHTVYVERFPGPYPFVLDRDYPGAHV